MRYLIKVVLLLLALSFVGAGMPFYMDTIDLNREPGSSAETPENPLVFEYDHLILTGDQHQINVSVDLRSFGEKEPADLQSSFSMELYAGEAFIKKISADEVDIKTEFVEIDGNVVAMNGEIAFEQRSLNLPDGNYRLLIYPKIGDASFNENEVDLTFSSISHYESARYESAANQTPLRLFFPDESSQYLIPVTRFVPQTNTTLRETVRQLEAGPSSSLGLFNRSPIPPVPRIQLSGGTASLYLSSQLGFYNEYPNIARMASYSLIESLGHIPEVRNIQFYFDNRIVTDGFRGVSTDTVIEPSQGPFTYAGYRAPNGRILLMPVSAEDANSSVSGLFENLAYQSNPDFYGYELQPVMPHDVNLLAYSIEDGLLTLNLNRAFEDTFSQSPVNGRLMLDALILTMTSLDEIERVLFKVEGRNPAVMLDHSMAEPWTRPPFINPET